MKNVNPTMARLFTIVVGMGLFLGTAASGWAAVDTASDPGFSPASVRRLAVLVLGQKNQGPSDVVVTATVAPGRVSVHGRKIPPRYGSPATGALENKQSNFQRFVEDEFVTALMNKHYSIAARSDLQAILKEKKLQLKLASESDAIECGKILSVPAVMVVSMTEYNIEHTGTKVRVTAAMDARLLSVADGKLLWSGKSRVVPIVPDLSSASDAVARLARSIAKAFPERPVGKDEPPEATAERSNDKPAATNEPTIVYLSDLKPRVTTAAAHRAEWPPVGAHSFYAHPDESIAGRGKPCYSLLVYDLPKSCLELTGAAAIGDVPDKTVRDKHGHKTKRPGAAATPLSFQILGDGRLLWKSRPLQHKNEEQSFQVDVSKVSELKLRVDCPGNAGSAWAIWKDPVLKK